MDSAPLAEPKPTRVVLRETAKLMRDKSVSYAKGFAFMGFLYSGCECVVEKHRARHDAYNATLAGCMTGGLMAVTGALSWCVVCCVVSCVVLRCVREEAQAIGAGALCRVCIIYMRVF
jgi:import inner membrane translocase subunit TIM22